MKNSIKNRKNKERKTIKQMKRNRNSVGCEKIGKTK